ncbi:MAG: PLP-dependent aminotransferase family protein [Oscillospiraceae bacterium]|jgi:2-aminoadipate transaminase|nr:PLP-dependent aminotransferase family protein [Oscillospiraceae bacterium]
MEYKFTRKVEGLKASAIREILKFTGQPGVISFAAGNPAPEAFPVDKISEISAKLLDNDPVLALQYSITEGYTPLRDFLKIKLAGEYKFLKDDELIITSGAQQAIDLSCKVLCDADETLICEAPSFIGSLNAFKSYNVNLVGVELDDDGINIELLENALKANKNTKLLYLIPNFQNPTGKCTTLERRKEIYALAQKYDIIIIEDDPYGSLRFAGKDIPSIKSLDTDGRVIYVGSFSKILSPGLRVGYVSANREIIQKITVCKQTNDVHTNIWAQIICYRFFVDTEFNVYLGNLRSIYKNKCELMLNGMDRYFSENVKYTRPDGGLFLWATLPEKADMLAFCKKAVEEFKIAVVPGTAFMVSETEKTQSFRLNYSTPSDEDIIKGIEILGNLTKNF